MRFDTKSLGYLCFLPPTALSVVAATLSFVRLDPGTAGGIGFLILIPLALLSLLTVLKGFVLT